MITLGKFNTLKLTERSAEGGYLDGKNLGEVFISSEELLEKEIEDTELNVFVYLDSDGLATATKKKPLAVLNEFALLRVKEINNIGAFLDWGIEKDLLVPYAEQKPKMIEGKSYLVYLYLDNASQRICASGRLNKFLDKTEANYVNNQEVEITIAGKTDLGYKVVVNKLHWGILYYDQVFKPLFIGQVLTGYVNKVRDDNKLDIKLERAGMAKVHNLAEQVLETLKKNNGFLPLGDKSEPELIKKQFSTSKANYKKAIGNLFKQGLIDIEAKSIKIRQ